MSDWQETTIGQLGRVVTGKTPPKTNPEYYDGNELFVSPKDLEAGETYVRTTTTTITEKAIEQFSNQVLPPNTIMFTSLSFGFGKMGITARRCLTNQQINSIIVNQDHDFRFVYYLLRVYTPFIFAFNSGIDTPIVPKSVFEKVQVLCPPLAIQRKIAAVLSAYDDLIENNRRRIALLEKMSEEIYREWFVRMRFPGYQDTKFIKGVPEGWTITKLKNVVELCYGKALKADDRVPGEYWVYGSGGIVGTHNRAMVHEPGLIVGRKGNVGSVYYSDRGFYPIDTVYYVKSALSLPYLYHLLRSMNFINNDAAVPGLNRNQAYSNQFFLPPVSLIRQFDRIASSQIEQRSLLVRSNENLEKTRDLLLGRLISGKLSVEHLDIQFPPSMLENAAREPLAETRTELPRSGQGK